MTTLLNPEWSFCLGDSMKECSVDGCKRNKRANGLCHMHAERKRKRGSAGCANLMREQHRMGGTPIYFAWHDMKTRCTDPNYPETRYYMGRGIKVCDKWANSFTEFYNYVGDRPTPRHSLDRINNNGDYEPGNVRWATPQEQVFNQRTRNPFGVNGIYKTRYKSYMATIRFDGELLHLGTYKTTDEAIQARLSAELELGTNTNPLQTKL